MRTFAVSTILTLSLALSSPAFADFDSALRAYEAGDYQTALGEFRGLAGAGDPDAQTVLALMYLEGQAVDMNMAEAIRWYASAAEQGQMDAQYALALIAMDGAGGAARDEETAGLWMLEAARRGHVFAQFDLGNMYAQGDGVAQSDANAATWFEAAAAQGHRDAQYNLGVLYLAGRGVDQDAVTALRWFAEAAEQGHPDAQYNLGISYLTGRNTDPNPAEAVRWLTAAADQDQLNAVVALGLLNFEGQQGVERDEARAAQLFQRAAEAGNAEGQYFLAVLYSRGMGVEQNPVEAYAWNDLAGRRARAGTELSNRVASLRQSLTELMNPSEIAQAETLARDRAEAIARN